MKAILRTLGALGLVAVAAGTAAAQTTAKPLDHDAYDLWNRIDDETLSPDGRWVTYALVPGDGDPTVVVRDLSTGAELRVERGEGPTFTDDSRFLVFTLKPAREAVDSARKAKKDDKDVEVPGDSLAVAELAVVFGAGDPDPTAVQRLGAAGSFRVPEEETSVVAYLLPSEEDEAAEEGEAGEGEEPAAEPEPGEPEPEPEPVQPEPEPAPEPRPVPEPEAETDPREERRAKKDDGATLVLRDLAAGTERRFEHVMEYRFSEDGRHLFFTASSEDGTADGLYRVDTDDGDVTTLLTGEGRYLQLAVSEETGRIAFLTDRDDQDAETPALALWTAGAGEAEARLLAAADAAGIPEGWWISEKGTVRFSEDGDRVFFGTRERPEDEDDEASNGDDEAVVVDVWNWKDDYLQPMQLVLAERNAERTFLATAPFRGGAVVQLETEELPSVTVADDGDGDVAMAASDKPYRQLLSWDGRYNDLWLIDVETGDRERVAERIRGFGGGSLSPGGRYVFWWDGDDREWWVLDTERREARAATTPIPTALHDELDDHPQDPPPYGTAGWTGDGRLLVYDAHDIWSVDPSGGAEPTNLTEGVGRRDGLRFRYVRTDPDLDFVPTDEDVLLSAFHLTEKTDGYYRDRFDRRAEPRRLLAGDYVLGNPRKAEDAGRYLLTRQTFEDFPDLYVTGPDFDRLERVSDANPQQAEYRWGTAELVEWMSADRVPLQGILYKPDGFDPAEQHPMMVYFYERMSDRLHRHIVPAAGSSSINISFYVSRGYLVFVPDIPYEIGFPGESAVDAVVPGVLALVDKGFVDPDRIGVQGHSWGGYQIAHMITRSHLFAAAEAGAPVANMTSAYGGIRWSSGMSRMFQYERTQSRIGGTLWDAQHRYIENSPLFFADKVETPLLMMHNDEDGAVPWYQGIEMFVALRRLGKPVWMLNYNGEDHGLRQDQNQKDWAIRMQQFFDHYLMDAPPPVWLAEGVPADEKGETLGLDLLTPAEMEAPVTPEGGGNR